MLAAITLPLDMLIFTSLQPDVANQTGEAAGIELALRRPACPALDKVHGHR